MKSGYKGEPYYQYYQYYESPLVSLISWLIPGLVIFGIWGIWRKRQRDKILVSFLLSLVIFSLLGINGAYPPLGKLAIWLYGLLPALGALTRFNFLFFGLPAYLGFTVLLGYGFQKINWFFRWPLLFLLVVVLVWPFWTGEVIRAESRSFPGERFQAPADWLETKEWLAKQDDFFRILPLPMSKTYNVAFDWENGYSGGDPTRWFTSQPVLNANTGQSFDLVMALGEAIEKETKFKDLAKLLGFLNVKYLLVRQDADWEFTKNQGWWFEHQPENIQEFIRRQPSLSLSKKIGRLEFYELDNQYLLPRFYAPQKITRINGPPESLISLNQFLEPENQESFLLVNDGSSDFIWQRPSEPGVYEINSVAAGDYQLLLRDDGLLRFYENAEAKLQIDNGAVEERIFQLTKDNLLSLGEIKLAAGNHKLVLSLLPINLIKIPGGWQTFKITADDKEKSINLILNDFRIGDNYQLSFRGRHIQGKPTVLFIWENYTEASEPVFQEIHHPFGVAAIETNYSRLEVPATSSWQDFDFTFYPHPAAKSVGLTLAAAPELITKTENWFDQVKVERIFDNPLILRNLSPEVDANAAPQISWRKINPTKYRVEIKNAQEPFWLVFSEAFHPGWRLSIQGEHRIMNGFANGWHLTKTGDYQVDVFFAPQRIFYLGAGISILTIIFSLFYLLILIPKA